MISLRYTIFLFKFTTFGRRLLFIVRGVATFTRTRCGAIFEGGLATRRSYRGLMCGRLLTRLVVCLLISVRVVKGFNGLASVSTTLLYGYTEIKILNKINNSKSILGGAVFPNQLT